MRLEISYWCLIPFQVQAVSFREGTPPKCLEDDPFLLGSYIVIYNLFQGLYIYICVWNFGEENPTATLTYKGFFRWWHGKIGQDDHRFKSPTISTILWLQTNWFLIMFEPPSFGKRKGREFRIPPYVPWSKVAFFLGMVIPPLIGILTMGI